MSNKNQQAPKRASAYRHSDEETFEKIKAQQLAALNEIRERTSRLRHLRLKKEAQERKLQSRKAARAGLSLKEWLEKQSHE